MAARWYRAPRPAPALFQTGFAHCLVASSDPACSPPAFATREPGFGILRGMSERPAPAVAGPEEGAAPAGVPAGSLPRRSRLRSYVVAEALAIALGYMVTTL